MSIRFINFIAFSSVVGFFSGGLALEVIDTREALASASQNLSPSMSAIVRQESDLRLLPSAANEQIAQYIIEESVPKAIERAFFDHSTDSFRSWQITEQFNDMYGWYSFPEGSYPENQIAFDAEVVDILYGDILRIQTSSDPILRTRDLPNPFNTSLEREPGYLPGIQPANSPRIIIETLPGR